MKKTKESHTSSSKKGMGDYYGQGIKNPVGKMRKSPSVGVSPIKPMKLKVPPRKLG